MKKISSPGFLLAILSLLIFLTELLVIVILDIWLSLSKLWITIIDPVILTALLYPFFYFWIYRPFQHKIVQHEITKEMLDKSIADYTHVIERNDTGMLLVDTAGIIKFINPAAEQLFRRKPGELIGQEFGFPIESENKVELDIYRGDKTLGTGEMSSSLTEWEGEKMYQVSIRDITERKKAEKALIEYKNLLEHKVKERTAELSDAIEKLKDEEFRLERAQNIAKLGNWELTLASGKLNWSKEMYNIFNCDPETFNLTLESFLHLFLPEHREIMNDRIIKTTSVINQQPFEFFIFSPDNTIKHLMSHHKVITDDSGNHVKIEGTVQDVTERKKAEEEILAKNNKLVDIAFMQSHQMRAPVAQILGLFELFNFDNAADPMNSEVLLNLKLSAESLDNIIHEINQKISENYSL